jgi:hypothetical protein
LCPVWSIRSLISFIWGWWCSSSNPVDWEYSSSCSVFVLLHIYWLVFWFLWHYKARILSLLSLSLAIFSFLLLRPLENCIGTTILGDWQPIILPTDLSESKSLFFPIDFVKAYLTYGMLYVYKWAWTSSCFILLSCRLCFINDFFCFYLLFWRLSLIYNTISLIKREASPLNY